MSNKLDGGREEKQQAHSCAIPRPVELGPAVPRPGRRRTAKRYTVEYRSVAPQESGEAARARVVSLLADLLGQG